MKLLLVLALVASALAAPTIESSLQKILQDQGSSTIIISFRGSDVSAVRNGLIFPQAATRAQKASMIYQALKGHADHTQANVLRMLHSHPTLASARPNAVLQLWITNQVIVRDASAQLIQDLLNQEDISEIVPDSSVPLIQPVDEDSEIQIQPKDDEVQWGVFIIEAPAVWAEGNRGQGAIIASIDSGVRVTHEALRDNFRAQNGWYDPGQGRPDPWDATGHGTHTIGTIVGKTRGVGVAPDAKFIACRACDPGGSCQRTNLLACGQWVVCPTDAQGNNPNCDLSPHAVSNSWGGSNEDPWYNEVMKSWIAADIVPLFSQGNSGAACRSANSPADSEFAIGIGSTDVSDTVSYFSSRGPTRITARLKPDISAPGSSVFSATYDSDTSYGNKSGTSMACPHVAGLTALLVSQRSGLTVAQVRSLLAQGAQPTKPTGANCGGIDENNYPNHSVGYGRINAKGTIEALRRML